MKKLLVISLSALFLSACADKEQYKEAVLAEMQKEQDIKDYKINPEHITDCVIDLTSKKMPGIFVFTPERLTAYRNYTRLLKLRTSENPQQTFIQLRKDFGSPKAMAEAKINYAESVETCITSIISESEEAVKKAEKSKGS